MCVAHSQYIFRHCSIICDPAWLNRIHFAQIFTHDETVDLGSKNQDLVSARVMT
jgi:hypothetical protein